MVKGDVLVLDDEPHVLRAVERTLAVLDVSVESTTDPYAALEVLAKRPPRVLVTDFRMPELDGVEVLKESRRLAPDTVRILLTGQADKENIIEAINAGKIFRYVAKPWDNEAFAALIVEAIEDHESHGHRRAAEVERHTLKEAVASVGDLQRSILPEALRVVDADAACSYSFCEHATGDYVDAFALPDGRTALLAGDVCGHGLGAALFVFTARALLRSGLTDGKDLADVVERTNRFLCRDMEDGRFLTLFAAVHDPARESLAYVNAGHASPLLVGEDEVRELPRTALPLGIADGALFDNVQEIPLRPDETLFAYTDGLTEARNPDRELFGVPRLVEVLEHARHLAPCDLLTRIRNVVLAWADGVEVEDDVALLALRPHPSPELAVRHS